jgi:predicted signal transduction protein with EAL and GGDEF domain
MHLCRELGLEVTAEGVERPAQLAALLRYQPSLLQGYLISHPVAEAEVPGIVDRIPKIAESLLLEAGLGADTARIIKLFPSSRQRSK